MTCADSSLKSTGVCASTLTTTLGTTAVLKPGSSALHLVVAGQQPLLDEEPRFVGDDGVGGLALEAGDGDGDAGQDGAAEDP